MEEKKKPEIIFGLVGAIGTDLERVEKAVSSALSAFDYQTATLKLSKLMKGLPVAPWKNLPETPEFDRYDKAMSGGNDFRKVLDRGDALALLAVGAIRERRQEESGDPDRPLTGQAYVLRSLKHPAEVKALRNIYGPSFFLIAAYCPREIRKQNLASKLASSEFDMQRNQFLDQTEFLVKRDESEREKEDLGQNVRDTFPLADVFVDASGSESTQKSVARFIELIFGAEIHTPSRDEYGMFHAQAAALRSAALGRQVGATITSLDGDIIAVGTNEVPRAGGGLYWCGDSPDNRDFKLGYEISDKLKRRVLGDLISRLKRGGWLSDSRKDEPVEVLMEQALTGEGSKAVMKGAHLLNSIEYFRAVHAEMAAIVDAARRGVAIRDCVLFSTTFPCHDCAKHIVATGIQRVVFIEPYPKSLAPELYLDSIAVDQQRPKNLIGGAEAAGYVYFESFVGVAPRQYMNLFTMVERKTKSGDVSLPTKTTAIPLFAKDLPPELSILVKENQEFKYFEELMKNRMGNTTVPLKSPQPDVIQMKKLEVQDGA